MRRAPQNPTPLYSSPASVVYRGQLRLWTTTARTESRQPRLEMLSSPLVRLLEAADHELRDEIVAALGGYGDSVLGCLMPALRSAAALPAAARRQLRALTEGRMIVEPGLGQALENALGDARLGYLDFETIQRAVPVWDETGPWQQVVVQFSHHEQPHPLSGDGGMRHVAYLAEGPGDPRPELVERLLEATDTAERIVMYSPFERTRINELAEQLPAHADRLRALAAKLVDLPPIVRQYVYHPDFRGSFSLKAILQPLVPELSYDDLAVVDGQMASVEIARLLFVAQLVNDRERARRDLLAYCERDTWAMVRLVERLRELAG